MEIINTPAESDYLFVSKYRPKPTANTMIAVEMRFGGTYSSPDWEDRLDNPDIFRSRVIDQYVRGTGFDYLKIAERLIDLSDGSGMEIRFSSSLLRVHAEKLSRAFIEAQL